MSARTRDTLNRVKEVLADLLDVEPASVADTRPFTELGFDTTGLTRAAAALQATFGAPIRTRQLIDTTPTAAALAEYLSARAPRATAADAASSAFGAASPYELQALFAEQLDVMQRQISLLSDTVGSRRAPARARRRTSLASGFAAPAALDAATEAHLERLSARLAEKGAKSKAIHQATAGAAAVAPAEAARVLPRAFAPHPTLAAPLTLERAQGAAVWDVDGHRYVDMIDGVGASAFGHNPPFLAEALRTALCDGAESANRSAKIGAAAEILRGLTGDARVVWCANAEAAALLAARLARRAAGRDAVAVFAAESGRLTGLASTPALCFAHDDPTAFDALDAEADRLAAVFVDPTAAALAGTDATALLKGLRAWCTRHSVALVFDDAAGLRAAPGGAQAVFGVKADLSVYAAGLDGGLPIAALGGRADYLDWIDGGRALDDGAPAQNFEATGGLDRPNPLAFAAAEVALRRLAADGPVAREAVNSRAAGLCAELEHLFAAADLPVHAPHFGPLWRLRIGAGVPALQLLPLHLRDRGVLVSAEGVNALTDAHADGDVAAVLDAVRDSLEEMRRDGLLAPARGAAGDEGAAAGDPAGAETDQAIGDSPPGIAALAGPAPAGDGALATPHVPEDFALTDAQREIWMASSFGADAVAAFTESHRVEIAGVVDIDALRRAVIDSIRAHQALRLQIDADGLRQRVGPDPDVTAPLIDLSNVAADTRSTALAKALADLGRAPTSGRAETPAPALSETDAIAAALRCRAAIIRLAPDAHVLAFRAHNLIADAYSVRLLFDEIAERYAAALEGRTPAPKPTAPFHVYAERIAGDDTAKAAALAYWRGVYPNGAPSPLELPVDHARGKTRDVRAATLTTTVDAALLARLRAVAADAGVGLSSLMLASLFALTGRVTGQSDLVIGLPTSGQAHHELETVGFCAAMLPIRADAGEARPFLDLAKATQAAVVDGVAHQALSMSDLIRALAAPRDAARSPLIEIVCAYRHADPALRFGDAPGEMRENPRQALFYDLSVGVTERADALHLDWSYATQLFDAATIERWMGWHLTLLRALAEDPTQPIGALSILSDAERRLTVENWNDTLRPYDNRALAGDAFEEQARRRPEATALICDGAAMSYGVLSDRSSRLARYLIDRGVGEEDLVGIHLDRSIDIVVAMLGVWKAGAGYLPLDPAFPEERLKFMVEDAKVKLVLSHSSLSDARPDFAPPLAEIDVEEAAIAACAPDRARPQAGARARAYILYTSGSTGKPKGVEIEHRSLVNFLETMSREPGFTAQDSLLTVTTISFDISILELFLPLSVGGQVVIATRDELLDGFAMADLIEEHGVTVLQGTPATWRLLLDADWPGLPGFKGLCGGEPMPPSLAEALLSRDIELWNMYGPTETTIWSTCRRISRADDITVGRPIANTQVYVVDDRGQPCPPGLAGELWIGGDGVARGYLGRPELTAERFLPNPFMTEPGARVYRTGDWARFRADGEIEFQSRRDNQVKVRGFRIELGEIETALNAHEAVAQGVGAVIKDGSGDAKIVAYTVFHDGQSATPSDLRRWLRKFLPDYMSPQLFMELKTLPKTNNNKIDRKALPVPEALREDAATDRIAPRTELEQAIAAVWRELLGVGEVYVSDNFFDLGGTSLQVAQMVARLRRERDVRLTPRAVIFETLEQLAADKGASA